MQRHKSTEKRARQSKKANIANRQGRSRINTAMKNVREAKDDASMQQALNKAYSVLDKSVKTKLIHANNASNKKAKLSKLTLKAKA